MTKYLLDSDILMDFFKKKEYAVDCLDKLLIQGTLVISTLSVTELRSGWTSEQAEQLLPQLYDLVKVLNLNKKTVELAGQYRQEYKKTKGILLPVVDTLIASTAILEKCQLVTRNKKDYPMSDIKFYPIEAV
ncbi:type II toxin-antitoxin system VapC family toxin [Candidatus Microgenomates bacterium]|nr:type II toxin-antitoxin system VapC family toxin [Candidatus Microgenomates bacterium]